MINRHGRCIGFTLFKTKYKMAQLWYCPVGVEVEKHSHNIQDIEIMYLFGFTTFFRILAGKGRQAFTPKWYNCFRKFSLPAGTVHWFSVSRRPLVFINFSTFLCNKKPISAAIDFHLVYH